MHNEIKTQGWTERGGGQEKTRDKKGAYFVWTPINKKTKKTNTSKKGKEKEKKERKEKEETDAYLKSLSHLEMLIRGCSKKSVS